MTRPLARHSLLIMPSLKTALFLASGAVLLPSLADASGIPERALVSAARQTARNAMAKVVVSEVSDVSGKKVAETATASDRRGLAEVQADEPWACLEYIGKEVCGSKETVATCEAETAYSCVWCMVGTLVLLLMSVLLIPRSTSTQNTTALEQHYNRAELAK